MKKSTLTAIQEFVATHDDCRVIFGPTWRAWSIVLAGFSSCVSQHLLLGRPRTMKAVDELFAQASRMVAGLEAGKRKEATT